MVGVPFELGYLDTICGSGRALALLLGCTQHGQVAPRVVRECNKRSEGWRRRAGAWLMIVARDADAGDGAATRLLMLMPMLKLFRTPSWRRVQDVCVREA